jgi:adenylate kinase family enzyme
VPLLGPDDPLPRRPQRVLVAGSSGSGKTTLAGAVAVALHVPQFEMDALFHGPAWTERPSFLDDVRRLVARPAWVTEWQYAQALDLLADRADLVLWLDLRRMPVMRQLVARTVRRWWRQVPLWNGNVEPPLWTLLTDPEHVLRWAWTTHPHTAPRVGALLTRRPDLVVVRLRDRDTVTRWLTGPLQAVVAEAG